VVLFTAVLQEVDIQVAPGERLLQDLWKGETIRSQLLQEPLGLCREEERRLLFHGELQLYHT